MAEFDQEDNIKDHFYFMSTAILDYSFGMALGMHVCPDIEQVVRQQASIILGTVRIDSKFLGNITNLDELFRIRRLKGNK